MLLLSEFPPPPGDTLLRDDEVSRGADVPREPTHGTTPTPGGQRQRWLAVSAVAALAVVGGFWWLIDSRVPAGDYDRVVAQLDERDAELTATEFENSDLRRDLELVTTERDDLSSLLTERSSLVAEQSSDIDRLTEDVDSLSAANDRWKARADVEFGRAEALLADKEQLVSGASDLADVVRASAYIGLNINPDWLAGYIRDGGDTAYFDALLADLGEDETIEEWVNEHNTWAIANRAVFAVGDDPLIAAWDRWTMAEPGSLEESEAWLDMYLHLDLLLVERAFELASVD